MWNDASLCDKVIFRGKKRVAQMHQKAFGYKKKKKKGKKSETEEGEWEREIEAGTFPIEFDSIKLLTLSGLASDTLVNTKMFYLIVKH